MCSGKSGDVYKLFFVPDNFDENFFLDNVDKMDLYERFSIEKIPYFQQIFHIPYKFNSRLKNKLLEKDVHLIEPKNEQRSELHEAVDKQDEHLVENLHVNGANVNVKDLYNNTPLHLLLIKKKRDLDKTLKIAKLLIENCKLNDT